MIEHRIDTPLGSVFVRVRGDVPAIVQDVTEPSVSLPPEMRIDGLRLVRLRLEEGVPPNQIVVVEAGTDGQPGSYAPGEHLDTMEFISTSGDLSIGVRDSEWLESIGVITSPTSFEPDHMSQVITRAEPGALICVSVAWRLNGDLPASDDLSTWFAVDDALPWNPHDVHSDSP